MPNLRMVVFGDSVPWGQGLLPQHKYPYLVQRALGDKFTVTSEPLAHSGATIGVGAGHDGAADGEVPDSYPTILEQCANYSHAPEDVDLVLVNGGINDVNLRTILDPLTSLSHLSDLVRRHCYSDMLALLREITKKFAKPAARILLTGYYPILSPDSDPLRIPHFLEVHCISPPAFLEHLFPADKIVELCLTFWKQSEDNLAKAVSDANAGGGGRVEYVPSPFKEENSMFTTTPWLFGVTLDLSPQDEVAGHRRDACDVFYRDKPLDILSREFCYRASAGHPNVVGAQQIAKAILAVLNF